MGLIANVRMCAARWLVGTPPPRGRRKADQAADNMPAFIPDANPLETGTAAELRSEHAMTIMDPDCYGYLLLCVRRQDGAHRAQIMAYEQLERSWWPAIREALRRLASVERV